MFLGEFQHTMDSKGRVVIPSKFRDELQQGCVITKGQDNCLQILTKSNWEEEAMKMASLPSTDRTSRQLRRALFSGAIDVKIDSAGRVQIPENLRVYSGIDINEEVVNLELKRKYQIDLSKMKDEHKERINSLKKLTSENIQKDVLFSELVKFLNVKVEQKELQEYIQKYYGEKIDQRTAETAYGTLLRNKIADESMKTFKIKETKLSLEELMKKGSQNHESSTHSH